MNQAPEKKSFEAECIRKCVSKALRWESHCLTEMISRVDNTFVDAVRTIDGAQGRLVTSGMGKMGFIARKAAATFSSTGTPSFFLHPGEAGHGDLGAVCQGDCLLALSYSGETAEIAGVLPYMRHKGIKVIGITGNPGSILGRKADITINIKVEKEADLISTAPTASTTLAMAVCDSIAVTLMEMHGFTKADFARYHPAGSLGRKLLMTVADLMHDESHVPLTDETSSMKQTIVEISRKALGCAIVVDQQGRMSGIITDGDLRRAFEQSTNPLADNVDQHMNKSATTVTAGTLAAEALQRMEDLGITVLPVVTDGKVPIGILHLHDLVRAGMA